MSYEEIYETYQEVAKEHINRDLFNHSSEDAAETIEDIKNNKIAIYTAFTGDYDTLKEPEVMMKTVITYVLQITPIWSLPLGKLFKWKKLH